MNQTRVLSVMSLIVICGSLSWGADKRKAAEAPKRTGTSAGATTPKETVPPPPPPQPEPGARVVQYGEKDVIKVNAKLRFATLIVLPKEEQILDFTCGDKELWIVSGTHNFAYVKPAKSGSRTNLNLITASGNIYSFVFSEISEVPNAEPDLKVFVEAKEESMIAAATGTPKFVAAQAVEQYRREVESAKEETRQAKESAQTAIDAGVAKFLANVRFPFSFVAGKKPFNVRAMYTDDKFTYLQARPEEAPTIYEVKDGTPNLVSFKYKDGVYVVEKILDEGYLAIGKKKLAFKRQD